MEVKDLSIFTTTASARGSGDTPSMAGGGAESQGSSPISADDMIDGLCLIVDDGQGEVRHIGMLWNIARSTRPAQPLWVG